MRHESGDMFFQKPINANQSHKCQPLNGFLTGENERICPSSKHVLDKESTEAAGLRIL